MPSNRVSINDQEHLSWEVPDSKMEAVITLLDAVSGRVGIDARQGALEGARVAHDRTIFGKNEPKMEIDEEGNVVPKKEVEGQPDHVDARAYCPKCMRMQRNRNATECEHCGGPTRKQWVAKKEEAAARTVTISGPLGSGKTTVAHLLTDFMRSSGIEVELGEMSEYDRKRLSEPMVEKPSEMTTRWWPVRVEIRCEGKVGKEAK